MNEQKFISELKRKFNGETLEFRGVTTLVIPRADLDAARGLHITVKFYGEVAPEPAAALTTALEQPPGEPRSYHFN